MRMIAKSIKGKSFRGVVAYDLQEGKSVLLETNMAAGTQGTVREFAAEFGLVRALRPSLNKAVCHVSLSLHPDEKLSDDKWCYVAKDWLEGMGYNNNQFIVSRHTDTEHPHIHILVNRISLDGSVVSDSNDYKRQELIMRNLEKEYGLVRVPSSHEVGRKAPTKGEVEHSLRTNQPSVRMNLQNIIDSTLSANASFPDFVKSLSQQGIDTKLNQASTGTISGISFAMNGVAFKGSQLGKGYTWKSLEKRGLIYENGYVQNYEHNKSNTSGEYTHGNNITNSTQRAGNLGDEACPSESTRESETAKQRRVAENFARLEREYKKRTHGNTKDSQRGTKLSL